MILTHSAGGLRRRAQTQWQHKRGLTDLEKSASFPVETLTAPVVAPRFGGMKFKGFNIVPRIGDSGCGPAVSPSVMYDLFYDYLTETNAPNGITWTHWLKPQIDLQKSWGCNCPRLYWDCCSVAGDVSHHQTGFGADGGPVWRGAATYPQLAAGIQNMCDYMASIGMYFYPTVTEASPTNFLTEASLLEYIQNFVSYIRLYKNVVAVDVVMEYSRSTPAMTGSLRKIMAAAQAGRGSYYDLPLTCSIWDFNLDENDLNAVNWALYAALIVAAGGEFIDIHAYLRRKSAPYFEFLYKNPFGLPVCHGEGGLSIAGTFFVPGVSENETVHPYSSELRSEHYTSVICSYATAHDMQIMTAYGTVDQWDDPGQRFGVAYETQDGDYNFTRTREDEVGPYRTIPLEAIARDRWFELDLTGADSVSATTTMLALGWGQYDFTSGGLFTRDSNRIKRAHSASATCGLLNQFHNAQVDQRVCVDFDASQAVASGGQINWAVGLRVQAGALKYYLVTLTSKPGDGAADGLLAVTAMPSLTQISSVVLNQPFDTSHRYRLEAEALGSWPTKMRIVVHDLTAGTRFAPLDVSDSSAELQGQGAVSLPEQIGTVYYTRYRMQLMQEHATAHRPRVTGLTASQVTFEWDCASSGRRNVVYIPQYLRTDEKGMPVSATEQWTSLARQTYGRATFTRAADTRYAMRVMVLDEDMVTPYASFSPWAYTDDLDLRVGTSEPQRAGRRPF